MSEHILWETIEEQKQKIAELEIRNNDLADENRVLNCAIKELKTKYAVIYNKLKCCGNCKYHSFWGDELKCNYGLKEALTQDKLVECKNMDKWEME